MLRGGAIIFGDLFGKLDALRVVCDKCSRAGAYRLNRLVENRGPDSNVTEWLDDITATCPKGWRATRTIHVGAVSQFIEGALAGPSQAMWSAWINPTGAT